MIPKEFDAAIKNNFHTLQEINGLEIFKELHSLFIHINIESILIILMTYTLTYK